MVDNNVSSKKYIKDILKKNKMNEQLLDRKFDKFDTTNDKEDNIESETNNNEDKKNNKRDELLQQELIKQELLKQELLKQELVQQNILEQALTKQTVNEKNIQNENNELVKSTNNDEGYLKNKLKKDLKEPFLIILVVLFYTNNNIIVKISNYVPGMIYENCLTTIGTLLRAVFIALTIYIIKKVIK